MRIPSSLSRFWLLGLVFGMVLVHASAMGHDHDHYSHEEDAADHLRCPCFHADKLEWGLPTGVLLGGSVERFVRQPALLLANTREFSFLPVRARSPPLP